MFFKERRNQNKKERRNQNKLDSYTIEHNAVMTLFNEGCVAYINGATLLDNPYIPYAPAMSPNAYGYRTHLDLIWRDGWLHRYVTEHK